MLDQLRRLVHVEVRVEHAHVRGEHTDGVGADADLAGPVSGILAAIEAEHVAGVYLISDVRGAAAMAGDPMPVDLAARWPEYSVNIAARPWP